MTSNTQKRAAQTLGVKAYQKPILAKGPLLTKVTASPTISGAQPT